MYSSGVTWQAAGLGQGPSTRFAPLAFDTRMHLWEKNEDWFIPAAGFEAFVQTLYRALKTRSLVRFIEAQRREPLGMRDPLVPAFDSGTIRGLMMLFRNTLSWDAGADKGGPARTFHLGMAGSF